MLRALLQYYISERDQFGRQPVAYLGFAQRGPTTMGSSGDAWRRLRRRSWNLFV